MQAEAIAHIYLDERGVPWIDDTNVKVIEVVQERLASGCSAEEIHFQHPHLSMAQIYAALSYYYDHQPELDAVIQRELEEVTELEAQAADSPLHHRLRATGLIP